ncbi:MAG TPA: hypothetical protein VF060_13455 [Trebonia sp.]
MGASPAARQRNADGLYGGHGEVAIRRLKAQSARAAEPQRSAASRAAVPLLAVMRARNWVTGLAVPIVAAIAVGIALVIVVGANGGTGGSAPSTLSAGFPPARDASADFTGTPALAGRGLSQSLSQVAVSGTTAVALGAQSGTPAPLARFFVSTNSGQTWRLATVRGTSAGGSPSLVAGGPHGWMAVGTGTTFVSPNGSSWLPSAPLPQQPGDTVTTLTATASGFLAAGENVPGGDNGQATPVVWLSANGTSWQRLSGAALPLTALAGRVGGITHTASSGNAVVITATAGGGSAVWRSADGGKTWAPVTIPAAAGESASIAGLAPLKAGFVAVRGAAGATQAAVYASADGMAWRRTATLATASGAALTLGLTSGGPAGAVVTGEADGLVIAFLSPDGVTWTGTDPVNTTGPEQVSGAALTGGGQALIAGAAGGKAALTAIGAHGAPDHVNLSAIPGANVAEVAVNAVASSAGDQVAAGSADGFPALWTSQDGGSTWARATGATQAVLGRQGENQLSSVTHGAAGWLAVGGALTAVGSGTGSASGGDSGIGDTGTAGPPVVVGSADGKTWMAADRETAFAGSGMVTSAAAAGPAGYVVVGRQVSGGQGIAAAWYSRGLTGWRRATDAQAGALDGGGNRQMNAVTAAAKGFVAVGSTGTRPAAWLSASGRTWSAIAVPAPAGAARAELRYVAANGNTVAADGVATTAAGQRIPFAAVSVNGGATWSQTLLPVPKGGAGSVTALAAAGGGFTATGTYGQPGAQDVVVWLLSEGAAPTSAWTAATPEGTGLAGPGTQAITALTGSGATLTGVGFAATAGAEEPTIWQSPVRG